MAKKSKKSAPKPKEKRKPERLKVVKPSHPKLPDAPRVVPASDGPLSASAWKRIYHHAVRLSTSISGIDELVKTREQLKKDIEAEKNRTSKKCELAADFFEVLEKIEAARTAQKFHAARLSDTVLKAAQGDLFKDETPEPEDDADEGLFNGPDGAKETSDKDAEAAKEEPAVI